MTGAQPAAVTFDADQTLWDFHGVHRKALDATAAEMVRRELVPAGAVDADRLQAVRDEVVAAYRGRPHKLEDVRQHSFEVFLNRAGAPDASDAAAALIEHFLDVRFHHIELFPEVRDTIEGLKGRYRLGLLSNGNTYPDRCGLPDTFDAVVLGPDHGFEKPDPRAFSMIADRLGVPIGSIAHVGDDADDIDGANRVGAVSILISRDGRRPSTESPPDHVISDLRQLEEVLENIALGRNERHKTLLSGNIGDGQFAQHRRRRQ